MYRHTETTAVTPVFTDERRLLWQALKTFPAESQEYRDICVSLLAPVICDLKKQNIPDKSPETHSYKSCPTMMNTANSRNLFCPGCGSHCRRHYLTVT